MGDDVHFQSSAFYCELHFSRYHSFCSPAGVPRCESGISSPARGSIEVDSACGQQFVGRLLRICWSWLFLLRGAVYAREECSWCVLYSRHHIQSVRSCEEGGERGGGADSASQAARRRQCVSSEADRGGSDSAMLVYCCLCLLFVCCPHFPRKRAIRLRAEGRSPRRRPSPFVVRFS